MADAVDSRVAVYIDFDNIVISRYNQLHGIRQFTTDRARNFDASSEDPIGGRIRDATVDIGAILDFASSFGSIVISRAYADWSATVNASYQRQLVDRAVDLTQLFTTTQQMKNGADIRLAVDVVEDLFRLGDITHVVIVAGDSDYIALAQRCKRLGRYVIGIGVAGSTSRSLAAACDEFRDYDALPDVSDVGGQLVAGVASDDQTKADDRPAAAVQLPARERSRKTRGVVDASASPEFSSGIFSTLEVSTTRQPGLSATGATPETTTLLSPKAATTLLVKAIRLGSANQDSEWMPSSEVKKQMRRMDPTFNESALGFKTFTDFIRSRNSLVEIDDGGPSSSRRIRMR